MLQRVITLSFLSFCLCVGTTSAQEEEAADPGALIISYFKCDFNALGVIANQTDSLAIPIYRELVDAGKLWGYGMMGHDWGGYENVIFWYSGESKEKIFAAQDEFIELMAERHPDQPPLACHGHRDAIYTLGPNTGPAARRPGTTSVSFFKCPAGKLGDIRDATAKMALPIWEEMVEAGDYLGVGIAIHDWAGYENVLLWRHAKDKSSLFAAVDKYGEMFQEKYPDLEPGTGPMQGCNTHRDQIYWWGTSTARYEDAEADM